MKILNIVGIFLTAISLILIFKEVSKMNEIFNGQALSLVLMFVVFLMMLTQFISELKRK